MDTSRPHNYLCPDFKKVVPRLSRRTGFLEEEAKCGRGVLAPTDARQTRHRGPFRHPIVQFVAMAGPKAKVRLKTNDFQGFGTHSVVLPNPSCQWSIGSCPVTMVDLLGTIPLLAPIRGLFAASSLSRVSRILTSLKERLAQCLTDLGADT